MIFNGGIYNEHWETKKLSELGKFSRGKSRHRPRNDSKLFEDGKYPLVQTGDVKAANLYLKRHTQLYSEFGLEQSKLWEKGTLCITIAANIAETAILAYPMCFPDSIVGFQAYENECSEIFMYYVFEYIRASIQNAASGSIQDNINIEYLTMLSFKIPTKVNQNKIVNILNLLDRKILLNNEINETLQLQCTDLYMHYFFNNTPNGVFDDIIIENDKSNIKVGDAKNISGAYPFFTSGEAILEWGSPEIDGRNIYLNTGGNADVKFYVGKAAYSTDTWCITANNQMQDYLYLLLKVIKEELNLKFFEGTGLKHLQKDSLKERPIYVPNEQEVKQFNDIVVPMFDMISTNIRENKELSKLRDWLLPMLMNGQVTISDNV